MEDASRNKYLESCSSLPSEALEWIVRQTHIRTGCPQMLSGRLQGEFLKILVQATGARNVLEIGTFTGYSAVCLASGLPEGGHLDALEINDELEDLIREGWRIAGLEDRITLHICDAAEFLRSPQEFAYDLVYIDADKREYCLYYDLVLPLLREGGLIIADDVCLGGKVYAGKTDPQTEGLRAFGEKVAADARVEQVFLPLRDGLAIIRKLP